MKVRSGFVSNSSSSSFMIAYRKPTAQCANCGFKRGDLYAALKAMGNSGGEESIGFGKPSKKDIKDRIDEFAEYQNEKSAAKMKAKYEKYIDNPDWEIIEMSFPYGMEGALELIKGLVECEVLEDMN